MARVIVLLGLVLAALARADEPYVCTNTCSYTADERPGITYQGGQQYKYEYTGEVISKTRVTGDEESKMSVKAEVIITARTECDHKMQVLNVMVEDVPEEESQWFRDAVEKYDMHYSYQDGWMEYLCPHEDEDVAATNFKRGILSALQTTVTKVLDGNEVVVQESDVSGECETRYQLSGEGDMVFNKTKLNCRYSSYLPYIPHQQYNSRDVDADLPFFRSDKNCKMELSGGVWKSVECKEEIELEAPFSASTEASTMASFAITSTLTLQSGPEAAQGNFSDGGRRNRRESLRMDLQGAIQSSETRTSNVTDVIQQIEDAIDQLSESIDGDTSQIEGRPFAFANLLSLVDKIQSQEDINEVWEANVDDQSRRQFLLDALVMCEHHHCVRLVAELAQKSPEVMSASRVMTWLTGSHFFTHAHPESVKVIMELAESMTGVTTQAIMAASTMVYRLCQYDPDNCRENAQPFLEYVEMQIGDSCGYGQSTSLNTEIKVALRALSNAGILPTKDFPPKCYSNKKVSTELRVAALQTYRRMGCPSEPEALWKILEDSTDGVEVRIAAYTSLVPCALDYPRFFTRIKHLLKDEDVNQVGSYIWTHLQNLAREPGTSNYHQELSRLAAHHTLQAKFITNAFRSSRNYRYAHFSEIMNLGGNVDSNVIFSPESYIPQRASVNLTLDMMERSINLFEFGGDFSGLEDYVERMFGKEGYFKHEGVQTLLEHLRPKRDIREDKIEEFQKLYDETQSRSESPAEKEAKASLYLRVFGNEVFYVDNVMKSNPWQVIQQLVKEFASPRSFKIIDQEYVAATQLGFPLRLKHNATASITHDFKAPSKLTDFANIVYESKISISAVVACDESLMVDGYGAWSGIRRRSSKTLHSDFGGRLEKNNGVLTGLQLDLPKEEVAKISSSVKVALYKNSEQGWQDEWPNVQLEKHEYCSPELVSKILGLKACAQSSFGSHSVGQETFQGPPYNREFTLVKTDTFDYYQLYFKVGVQDVLEIIFEAPGSSVPRKIHFLVNLGPDGTGGYIVIRGIGYDLQGLYENTETSKKLSLKYIEDSTTQGGIELSLQSTRERSSFKYTPKIVLTLGPDIYSAEGDLDVNLQGGEGFRSSWKLEAVHHKKEGRLAVSQSFGAITGSLNVNEEKTDLQLRSEYGTDRAKAHSISLTLDSVNKVEDGKKKMIGHLFMESTQGQSNLTLNYEYSPGNAHANASVTITGTQVSTQIVVKNLSDDKERDFQMTLGLTSPELDIDYLGHALYKATDSAFQTEAEINLGSAVHSKASLTYVYEEDPLHFLTGIHLSFNEYFLLAENSIDLSKPGKTIVTLSGSVGSAVAGFLLQANHDYNSPFNTTLDLHAKYEDQEVGFMTSVTSDEDWQHFTGSVKVKWFDENLTIKLEADWSDDNKRLFLTSDNYGVIQITTRVTPNDPFLQLLLHSTEEVADEPDFQVSVGMNKNDEYQLYQANLTTGSESLFATTVNITSDQEYSCTFNLLASELMIMGQYSKADYDDFEGSAEIKATLPSGDVYSTNLALNHSYDGTLRNIEFSSSYGDDLLEGQLSILHRDGWFSDDSSGVNFTLTTPFTGISSLGFSFEVHSDLTVPNFAEIEWEEIKLRGVVHVDYPKNFEATLQYEDGGTCDSHFSIYHNSNGDQYTTGATLSLTQDLNPWGFEVNTTKNCDYYEKSLGIELSFQSPMLENPFEGSLIYNLTNTKFDFEVEVGLEEKVILSINSLVKKDGDVNKFMGTLEMDSPWSDHMVLNVTGSYNDENIYCYLDFKSSWPIIQSATVEFAISFISPDETKFDFHLNHDDLQILMAFSQKLSDYTLTHELESSINTLTVTYELETEWDYYHRPKSGSGHLSLLNLMDHNLDVSLSLKKEMDGFVSQVSGSWDDQAFKIGYTFDYKHPLEWSNDVEIIVPGNDYMIKANISLDAIEDLSRADFKAHFSSPWTEDYDLKFIIQTFGEMTNYEFDVLQAATSLLRIMVEQDGPLNWDQSNIKLNVTTVLFDNIEAKWQHNIESERLVFLELSYGSDFYIQGRSHLKHTNDWFNQELKSYSFSANVTLADPKILFDTTLNLDSDFTGDFAMRFDDYSVLLTSAIFNGVVFQAEAAIPDSHYKTELVYEKGRSKFPDIIEFKLIHNDASLLSSKIKFESVYPQFDALISLTYSNENNITIHSGDLKVSAKLDYNYGLKGTVKLTSDLEGFENHTISIDTDLTIKHHHLSGFMYGHLQLNDQIYNGGINASFAIDKKMLLEFGANYDITSGGQIDKKDVGFLFTLTGKACLVRVTVILAQDAPPWALFLQYKINQQEIKGYAIIGDSNRYEMSIRLGNKIFTVNIEIIEEDETTFKVLQGNVNWIIRKPKHLYKINMASDYAAIAKVTATLEIQLRRGLAAEIKLKVNEENLVANLRLVKATANNPGKLYLTVENNIYSPLSTVIDLDFASVENGFKTDLTIQLNEEKEWITATLNVGLPVSYLRFKTPFEELNHFNLTIDARTTMDYNLSLSLEVPQFCFNFEGTLDKHVLHLSISAVVDLQCSGTDTYEFTFNHNLEFSEDPLSLSTKLDLNGYVVFDFDISFEKNKNKIYLKMEGTVLTDYSLGVTLAGDSTKQKGRNLYLNLRIYEPPSNNTHFLFENSFSGNQTEIKIELLQDNTISFEANYDFTEPEVMFTSNYSHSLFGNDLNINFVCEISKNENSGNFEMHFDTDASYDHVDLSVTFEIQKGILEATFNLTTPTGDAEIRGTYEPTENSHTFIVDMLSSLHTFRDYHYELVYMSNGSDSLKFVSAQDNVKFEFQGEISRVQNDMTLKLFFDTPFTVCENVNLTFGFPRLFKPENNYQLYLGVLSNGEMYMLNADLSHHRSFKTANTEIHLFTPYDALNNVTLSLTYDLDGQVSLGLDSRRGRIGIDTIWNTLRSNLNIKVTVDLSYFNQGEYIIDAEIPYDISRTKGIKLVRQKTNLDFVFQIVLGEKYRNGLISLMLMNLDPNIGNRMYLLSYIYDGIFNINGQFGNWEAMLGLELYDNPNSIMSGRFEINTNFQNYESFEGTWDINQKGSIYNIQLQIDVNTEGLIIFDATFDTQAHSVATPWDSIKLDVLFESPFTLSHHIHVEYQMRILTLSASYQYGIDTFYFNAGANIHPTFGTITITGKIPVYGFSSFDLRVRYTMSATNSLNVMVSIEETTFETGFEIISGGFDGSVRASLVSPFLNPMGATLTWSKSNSAIFLEAKLSYGMVKGSTKMTLEYSEAFANFELEILTPFNAASKITVAVKYDVSDLSKMNAVATIKLDAHIAEIKADLSLRKAKALFSFEGSMEFFGIIGNLALELKKNSNSYQMNIVGNVTGLKQFILDISLDIYHLHFSWVYDSKNILVAKIDYDNTNVVFNWDKYNHFNLTAYRKPLKKGHELGIDFVNHNMQTVNLYATYLHTKGHKFRLSINSSMTKPILLRAVYLGNKINLKIMHGEKVHNFATKFLYNSKEPKGTINFHFDSSDDPRNPIKINAFYDLKAFLNGQMKSMKNLTYASFEWGEKIDLLIQGKRSQKHIKLVIDVNTPFKYIPKLDIGFDWELINNPQYVVLELTSYFEWSEKVSLSGHTKFSRDLRNIDVEWSLKTPHPLVEEFTVGCQWKEGHAEAMLSYNNNKWKFNCDYEMNPFSSNISIETPITGFETITFIVSYVSQPKFEAHAELSWPGSNTIGIQVNMEMWKLEVGLITPWSPFKNVLFFTSFKTESEEGLWSATLQWDERRLEITLALSFIRFEFSGKYFMDTEEIGIVKAEFTQGDQEIHAEVEIKTPYDIESLSILFHIGSKGFSFKLLMNDMESTVEGIFSAEKIKLTAQTPFLGNLYWTMEANTNWREVNTYATFVHPEYITPFNVSFAYKVDEYTFPITSVFKVQSDQKWVSIEIDLAEVWTVALDILGNCLELKLSVPSRDEMSLHVHFESKDLELESMTFEINGKYSRYGYFLNVTSTLALKLKDQFLSKHELVLYAGNEGKYLSATVEVYSDYISDRFDLKSKLPLFNIFTQEGEFELTLLQGGKQMYRLFYETVLPSRRSATRHLMVLSPEWEVSLTTALTDESLNIYLSYPKPTTEHTLFLTWSNDFSLERFVLGVEVTSPYLEKGEYRFGLKFNLRGMNRMKLESVLMFGTKTSMLKGQFHYNRGQKEVRFETEVTSNWFGDHSVDFNIDWERDILVTGKLVLLENEHRVKLNIDMEAYTVEFILVSPLLPTEEMVITAKLIQDSTAYAVEGKYTTSQSEINFEGKFKYISREYPHFILSVEVGNDNEELFKMSASLFLYENNIKCDFDMQSVQSELNTHFELQITDDQTETYVFLNFVNSFLHIHNIQFEFMTDKQLMSKNVKFWFNQFLIDINFNPNPENFGISCTVGYHHRRYMFSYGQKAFGRDAHIAILTPFDAFEKFQISYSTVSDHKYFNTIYQWEGEEILLSGTIRNDPVIRKSFEVILNTPFEGYERFAIYTPQFYVRTTPSLLAKIEYPTGKVGVALSGELKNWAEAHLQAILYLPFEEHEIMSFQYVVHFHNILESVVEARVGKFGFTFSLKERRESDIQVVQLLIRLNELELRMKFKRADVPHQNRIKIYIDLEPHNVFNIDTTLGLEFKNVYEERLQFLVWGSQEEYLNLHLGWKAHKVFTISTPKMYPGYVHINYELTEYLDDYRVQVGLAPGIISSGNSSSWDTYGFQAHQEILKGGRQLSLSAEAFGGQFLIEGGLALDTLHLNESLIFELNHRKMGYTLIFQKQPGFIRDMYIEDIFIVLPNQTLHWNTSAECSNRQFELSSRFTWNELDSEMPPITIKVTYDDNSVLSEEDHNLMAIFSHPDIKEITFQGNVTKLYDTPLTALGELTDLNMPERNIIMVLSLDSVTEYGEQTMLLNISQPYSNFSLALDAQVVQSIFNQAEYSLTYFSLSEENVEEIYVSTLLNASEHGYNFMIDIFAPESDWGYNCIGDIHLLDSRADLSLQGTSKEFGDFWKLGTSVNQYLPELEVKLQIGQENEEPYETGRLRLGLHNPLKIGAILDHQRFGVWEQDSRIGLNLKTQSILQFIFEFDPSLDYVDDDFLERLTSPADQIRDAWLRDLNSTISSIVGWGTAEAPAVFEALLSQETLQIIWDREESNWDYLKNDFNTAISDTYDDLVYMWTDILQPAWEATHFFVIEMYTQLLSYFGGTVEYLSEVYNIVAAWSSEAWIGMVDIVTSVFDVWSTWFIQIMTDQWNKILEQWTSLVESLTLWWTAISDATSAAFSTAHEQIISMTETASMYVQETAASVQTTIQPFFDGIAEAFTKYGEELSVLVTGKCWESIKTKADEVAVTLQEMATAGLTFFSEFLQIDVFHARFVEIKDKVVEWAGQLWISIEGVLAQVQQSIIDNWQHLTTVFSESITQLGEFYNALQMKIETDGFATYMGEKWSEIIQQMATVRETIITFLTENFEAFKSYATGNVVFDYINAVVGNVYEKLAMVWNRWRHEERNNLDILERVVFSLADTAEKFLEDKNYLLDEVYVWKPEDYGRVEYNQLLPLRWNSFLEAPKWHPITRIFYRESPMSGVKRAVFEGMHNLAAGWGAFHLHGSLTPPFTATATIFGQHVTTFDLRHYQFLGSCTYLLTRDFVDNDFEVIGDYQRSDVGAISLNSLKVRARDTEVTLNVDGSYIVTKPGTAEMYFGGDYCAMKMDDLFVTCNKVAGGCSITVSGKYFGRLAGLLGNYNYEPSDDQVGPDGSRARHAAELGRMWAVSSDTCFQGNQVIQVKDLSEAEDIDDCWKLFLQSSSPYSSCFHHVDPRPYFDHCVRDQSQPDFGQNLYNSPCDAVAAYRTQCSSEGVHLPPLDDCQEAGGSCQVFGESVPSGWNATFQGNTEGSTDVAFVIEVANCNKHKDLIKLLDAINVQFKKNSIVDVQYALVTTSGETVAVPTAFMSAAELAPELRVLLMKGPPASSGGDAAVITAARNLKWRPGVSRNIIQLTCEACHAGDPVGRALRDNDIAYHIISKGGFDVEGPNRKASRDLYAKVFGYDEKFVYMAGDYKKLRGNADVREMLVYPEGTCSVAAQSTGGTAFSAVKWNHKKPILEKKFLNVVAQRVAQTSISPECQECRCGGRGTKAKLICRKCSTWKAEGRSEMQEDETLIAEIKRNFREFYHDKKAVIEQDTTDS